MKISKWRQTKSILVQHKGSHCADCGVVYPDCCFDFDHRDPTKKKFTIGELMNRMSLEVLLQEIEKCDLVCSNCHRIRNYGNAKVAAKQISIQKSGKPGMNSRARFRKIMVEQATSQRPYLVTARLPKIFGEI